MQEQTMTEAALRQLLEDQVKLMDNPQIERLLDRIASNGFGLCDSAAGRLAGSAGRDDKVWWVQRSKVCDAILQAETTKFSWTNMSDCSVGSMTQQIALTGSMQQSTQWDHSMMSSKSQTGSVDGNKQRVQWDWRKPLSGLNV